MNKVVIVVGPTAVGKTALSIELAKKFNGEIISADSVQIYKGLDVGSAKVTSEEADGIIHHMLDIVEPTATYSTGEYASDAKKVIEEIHKKGKIPIMVGGTGLYVNSVLFDLGSTCGRDEEYRASLMQIAKEQGRERLHEMLNDVDPESASLLHVNQLDRIIRALEIYHITGKKKSQNKNSTKANYDYILIGLTDDRDVLYDRINKRVDKMLENGLLEEVDRLIKQGLTLEHQSMQGLGYKETYSYLTNKCTKEEFIDKLKQNSRNYAKRQFTFFKKMPNIVWKKYAEKEEIFNLVGDFINE
ncbi:MAG: tRNA (adenosine(37)-N6)-dimethylallyltransferase MiaA [Clostridia bacterium]|nr:tRNA (adenosine(37)-N6)-dimethylallyltransferase MiaA [Clostridia bacterium]